MELSLAPTAISSIHSSANLPSAACSFISTGFASISLGRTATDATASLLGTLDIEPHKGPWFDEQLPLIELPDEFPQSWTAHYRPLLTARLLKLEKLLNEGSDEEFVKTYRGAWDEAAHKLSYKNGGKAYHYYMASLKIDSELVDVGHDGEGGITSTEGLERLKRLAEVTDKAVEARRHPQETEMPTPIPDGVPALDANFGAMGLGFAVGVLL